MAVSAWINRNPSLASVMAVGLLVLALGLIVWQVLGEDADTTVEAYYLDLEAGELFLSSANELPPIETPTGGGRGVRAHVYACGECPAGLEGATAEEIEARGAFVAWLERYTDEAKQTIERLGGRDSESPLPPEQEQQLYEAQDRGLVVGEATGDRWVQLESDAGRRLMDGPQQRCDDQPGRAVRCEP